MHALQHLYNIFCAYTVVCVRIVLGSGREGQVGVFIRRDEGEKFWTGEERLACLPTPNKSRTFTGLLKRSAVLCCSSSCFQGNKIHQIFNDKCRCTSRSVCEAAGTKRRWGFHLSNSNTKHAALYSTSQRWSS